MILLYLNDLPRAAAVLAYCAAGIGAGIGATPVLAQAYQCRMPAKMSVPAALPDGPVRRLPVAGYTLALSWSPQFCKGRQTRRQDRIQCSGANGRFSFVVHGLWPQSSKGQKNRWPQFCPTTHKLTPTELRRNLCMMPSARLIARQWAKHGSCMKRPAETYFKVTRILWNSLKFPDMDQLSRKKGLSAGHIRNAIAASNDGIEPRHIGIDLGRKGWLEEVHICYGKRFRPAPCGRSRSGAMDKSAAKIWRGP